MAKKRWIVELCDAERLELGRLINTGRTAARTILKARILLKADQASGSGWTDTRIAEALETSITHVANTIPHQCDHGRAARRCRIAVEVRQNSPKSLRTSPKAGANSQIEHPRTANLEKGGQYANITASIKSIWGISG